MLQHKEFKVCLQKPELQDSVPDRHLVGDPWATDSSHAWEKEHLVALETASSQWCVNGVEAWQVHRLAESFGILQINSPGFSC